MARVVMYSSARCAYCRAAERLLARKGVRDVEVRRIDLEPGRRAEMTQRSGRRSVPQIWIGDRHIGGFDALQALEEDGELDRLLASAANALVP
jgi:glutaredoxin 3